MFPVFPHLQQQTNDCLQTGGVMRNKNNGQFRTRVVVLIALAATVPCLGGCSTLGIATADDLTATESRLQNSYRANATRIENLEQSSADMQQTLNELSAGIDSLNTRFQRAKTWLETMNLDTIARDAQEASTLSLAAEARSREFFAVYLDWIKSMQALLQQQITLLESKMGEDPSAKPEEQNQNEPQQTDEGG
jgi:methyl-accepting chemotaxis protein